MRKNFTRLITNVNSMKWQPQVAGLLLLFMMLVSQTAVGQTIDPNGLSPNCAVAGQGFELTVTGTGFISSGNPTMVRVNGSNELTPTNISSTQLRVTIPANLVLSTGLTIEVGNKTQGSYTYSTPRAITVLSAPRVSTTTVSRCGTGAVTLSASGAPTGGSYRWYNAVGSVISGETNASYSPNVSTDTFYEVSTVFGNCESPRTRISVVVNNIPSATITTTTPTAFCTGGSVVLRATANPSSPATGNYTYQWRNGGTNIPGANSSTYTATTSGSYTVVITNPQGPCPSEASAPTTVTVNPIPQTNSVANRTHCNTEAGEAIVFSGSVNSAQYAWTSSADVGFGLSGTGNIAAYAATNIGSSPVTATVNVRATANGCTGSERTFTITVNPTPTVNNIADRIHCNSDAGAAITFGGSVSGAQYTWTSSANIGFGLSGTGNITPYTAANTGSSPVTATVTVRATANDCTGPEQTFTVTVNPTPVVQVTSPDPVCTPNTVNLQAATVTAGSTAGLTYTYWSNAAATSPLANPSAVASSGTYYIKGTTAAGCFDIKPVSVVVNQTPDAPTIVGTAAEICGSGTTRLTVTGAPTGGSYQWYTAAGTAIQNETGSTYTTPTINATTRYYVSIISAAGCESATRTEVTAVVNPIPGAPTVATPDARCGAGPVSMTATAVTNANSAKWYSESSGGNLLHTGLTYSPTNVSATTTFYVSSYNTVTGCESQTRTAVTATVITPPVATVTTSTPRTFCNGGQVVLTAQITPPSPEQGSYTYQWRKNGIDIPGAESKNPTFTASETGDYSVVVSTTVGECVSAPSSPVAVTVLSQPVATVIGRRQEQCIGANNSTSFTVSGTFANGNARWTSSNPDFAIRNPSYNTTTGIATATVVATGTGSSIITLTTSNSNASCNDASSEITLTVNPLPVAAIVPTGPTTFCVGDYVILEATEAPAGQEYSYEWFINNGSQVIGTDPTFEARVSGNYTVKITTKPGCSATSSPIAVKVDQLDVATVSVTRATTFCQGGSVRLDAVKAPSGQEQYSYQWYKGTETVGTNSSTYIANATGEYYVVVSAQGCEKTSDKVTVTVLPQPTASVTVPAENGRTVCQDPDEVTTFTVSGTFSGDEATWTSSNTSFVISGRNDVLNASTGITTSTITVTVSGVLTSTISSTINLRTTNAAASCAPANSSISLAVNPIPVATITPSGNTEFCAGNSITLTASAGSSYLWSTGATTRVITVSTSGDYSVTVTNSSGCSITSPVTSVKVNALPDVRLAAFEPVCKDQEAFTLTGGLPAGGTYTINGVAATQFNPASYAVGNHTIVYTYRDGNNCSASASQTIQVKAVPVVTLSAIADRCINAVPLTLTGGSPAGGTYSGIGVANGVFNPAMAGVGIHTITYSYTDNGCTKTATNTIEVTPTPVVALAAFNNVCVNATAFTLTGGSPTGGTYSGTGVSSGRFNPTTAGVGTHTITYTYSENGCTRSATNTITVNPLPTASAGTYAAQCVGTGNQTVFNLTAGSISNGTPAWEFVGGTNGATATIANANTMSPNVTVSGTGTVTIRLTVASNQTLGCTPSATSETTLTVNALPVVSITSPENDSYCTAQGSIPLTGNPTGGSFTVNGVTATAFNPSTLGAGTYTIVYRYTNGTGCINTATKTVVVNQTPTVLVTNPAAVCTSATVNLQAAAVTAGSTAGLTYTYWTNAAATTQLTNPAAVAASGTYYIKGTTSAGCFDIKPVTVTVNQTPTIVVSNPAAVCAPATVNLQAAAVTAGSTAGLTYTYWTNAAATTQLTNPAAVAASGTYYIKGTTSAGCFDIKPVTVTVNPNLPVSFTGTIGASSDFFTGQKPVALSASPAGGIFSGPGVDGTTFSPCNAGPGTHTITYTRKTGECTSTVTKTITVLPSKYTVIVTANNFPICRGQNTDYTAHVYRDVERVVYPYRTNANNQPVNAQGRVVGDNEDPAPNQEYIDNYIPAGTPALMAQQAWRFFKPVVILGSNGELVNDGDGVDEKVNLFDYRWTRSKSDGSSIGPNIRTFGQAGLSATDWMAVWVSPKNSTKTTCANEFNILSSRIYLSEPNGYVISLSPVVAWCFSPNDQTPVTLTANLGNLPGGWNETNVEIKWYLRRTGQTPILLRTTTGANGSTVSITEPRSRFLNGDEVYVDFSTAYDSYVDPNSKCAPRPNISEAITIRIDQPAAISANLSTVTLERCAQGSINFTVTATGTNLQYRWFKVGNTVPLSNSTNKISGALTNSITISNLSLADAGQYYVVVSNATTTTSACNVSVTSNQATLVVNALPTVAINSQTTCAGQPATITAVASGGTGSYTYNWTVPAGVTNPGNVASFATTIAGNYTVRISDSKSCQSAVASLGITFYTLPTVSVNNPSTCAGVPVAVTAVPAGGTGTYQFTWTVPASWTGPIPTTASFQTSVPGTYTVRVTDGRACASSGEATSIVTVKELPSVTVNNVTVCEGATATVTATPADGIGPYTYTWTVPSGVANPGNVVSFQTTTAGQYSVRIQDSQSCSASESATGTVIVNPITYIKGEILIYDVEGNVVKPNQVESGKKYAFEAVTNILSTDFNESSIRWYAGALGEEGKLVHTGRTYIVENMQSLSVVVRCEIPLNEGTCYDWGALYMMSIEEIIPLPVELLYFNAKKQGADVVLDWATASELDNKGFEVQVSSDAKNFRVLGFVESKVNTTSLKQLYTFVDKENGKQGVRYYRLKQVDLDGKFEIFNIKAVHFDVVSANKVKAYPNPFQSEVELSIDAELDGELQITVTTATGQQLLQRTVQVAKGTNIEKLTLDPNLPRGVYIISTRMGDFNSHFKLLKQ